MEEYPDLGHGYAPRQETREYHKVKPVDPYQVPLVEALDDGIPKVAVDGREGAPELPLPAAVAVYGTLRHVIHAVLGVVGVVLLAIGLGLGVVARVVDVRGAGVDGRDVVQDGPEDALAKAVVPVHRWGKEG